MPEYKFEGMLGLESGESILNPTLFYTTYGELNADKSNVIWVCHALTADSNVFDWWPGLFGHSDLFNPDEHYIICANMLGSCYGSTGPLSLDAQNGSKFYHRFPSLSLRDIARMNNHLANHLGIQEIEVLIGGSMGGQQALEWAVEAPDKIKKLVLLATNAVHSPWGVAYNEVQRRAIALDSSWVENTDDAGKEGLKTARGIAMLSYRTYASFNETQQSDNELIWPDRPLTYLEYQGEKLANRFNAYAYWSLSKAMDSHNLGRGRGGVNKALSQIKADTLVLTLEGDNLFPESEQQAIVNFIYNARHLVIPSGFGHDGFLIETSHLNTAIREFMARA